MIHFRKIFSGQNRSQKTMGSIFIIIYIFVFRLYVWMVVFLDVWVLWLYVLVLWLYVLVLWLYVWRLWLHVWVLWLYVWVFGCCGCMFGCLGVVIVCLFWFDFHHFIKIFNDMSGLVCLIGVVVFLRVVVDVYWCGCMFRSCGCMLEK